MINILHVDDNPDDLELSRLLFKHLSDDVQVAVASSASEAVSSIAAKDYDAIICDYNLPDVDGLSFLQNLRQAGDSTPFIFLTGEGDEEVAATALRNGADDYYVKKAGTGFYRDMLARIKKLNENRLAMRAEQQAGQRTSLHKALDSLDDAVFIIDPVEYRISYCNAAVKDMFGYPPGELIGSSMERLVLSRIAFQDLMTSLSRSEERQRKSIQMSLSTREKDIVIAEVNLHRFTSGSEGEQALVLTARDDSRNRIREIALREHINELEKLVDELSASRKDYESFIYSVSHDLRGHVNNIVEFSRIIAEDYKELSRDQLQKYASIIVKTGTGLKKIIQGLTHLARASNAVLDFDEVNLSLIAENVLDALQAEEPGRDVLTHVESNMKVVGDEGLLRMAITNLLKNAWKYTQDRSDPEISFRSMEESGKQVYYVEDNGIGFPAEQRDKLFQPFQRLSNARTFPGTGLGLAITQRIIHRHGGAIWAESEVGEGTSFYFTLS